MKTFYVQNNSGSKYKYVVRYYDGSQTHKDGSPFFELRFFKNKHTLKNFTDNLARNGYSQDQWNTTGVECIRQP